MCTLGRLHTHAGWMGPPQLAGLSKHAAHAVTAHHGEDSQAPDIGRVTHMVRGGVLVEGMQGEGIRGDVAMLQVWPHLGAGCVWQLV